MYIKHHEEPRILLLKETHKAQIVGALEKEGRQEQRGKMLWQQFLAFRAILSTLSRAAEFKVKRTPPQRGIQTTQHILVDQVTLVGLTLWVHVT